MVKPVYPLQLRCGGYNKTAIEQRGEAQEQEPNKKTALTSYMLVVYMVIRVTGRYNSLLSPNIHLLEQGSYVCE
jgi:hypothetical protein